MGETMTWPNFKNLITALTLISGFYLMSDVSFAQTSTSTGRSNAIVKSIDGSEIKAIQNIRKAINEGDFNDALRRSNKIIKSEDRGRRSGTSYSEYYKEAYNCLCVSYTGLGRLKDAIEACNTSIELSPNHWESFKSRATVYYMAQMYPESLIDFENSLNNAPHDKEIKDALEQNISLVKSKSTSN
jgi:tetratricopeptide (TPR) repeat protein